MQINCQIYNSFRHCELSRVINNSITFSIRFPLASTEESCLISQSRCICMNGFMNHKRVIQILFYFNFLLAKSFNSVLLKYFPTSIVNFSHELKEGKRKSSKQSWNFDTVCTHTKLVGALYLVCVAQSAQFFYVQIENTLYGYVHAHEKYTQFLRLHTFVSSLSMSYVLFVCWKNCIFLLGTCESPNSYKKRKKIVYQKKKKNCIFYID